MGAYGQPSSSWEHPCHFFDGTAESVRWIFALDVLNHCFWPDPGEPVWTAIYKGEPYSGYWGLAASLKRAQEQGFPITDPHFLSGISAGDLAEIFSGQGRMPMFEERLKNLREAGSIILSELGGDIISLFDAASGSSAVRLASRIVSLFPSFRDEALYRTERVYFWKRAQIFAFDVFTALEETNGGNSTTSGGLPHLPTTSFRRCSGSLESFHIIAGSRPGLTPWNLSNGAPKRKSRFGQ